MSTRHVVTTTLGGTAAPTVVAPGAAPAFPLTGSGLVYQTSWWSLPQPTRQTGRELFRCGQQRVGGHGGARQENLGHRNWRWTAAAAVAGTLSLWVKDRDGGVDRACAWTATPTGRVRITGATPVQLARIASVEMRDEQQQTVAVIAVPQG